MALPLDQHPEGGNRLHTYQTLTQQMNDLAIDRAGTLLVHSSMKAIGPTEGGADTVLDVLQNHMREGLLVLPTHTWSYVNAKQPRFSVLESASCVGLLTERFRLRPGVFRSLHPTHSVAAAGADAEHFTAGDERFDTPCARESAWGRLLDRQAVIMLLGVDLTSNTFIHGIEEWLDIPDRLTPTREPLVTIAPDGREISVPSRRHVGSPSENFDKIEPLLLAHGIMRFGQFGDAVVRLCDTVGLNRLLSEVLTAYPDLFDDDRPLTQSMTERFSPNSEAAF